MRVIWISDSAPAGLTHDIGHFERHRQASLRFRIGQPARALAALGVQSAFLGIDTPGVLAHLAPGLTDVVVFGKLSTPRGVGFANFATAHLATADHARRAGLWVVVDLADNVLGGDRSDFFAELLSRADALTVATDTLGELTGQRFRGPLHVIGDPVEGDRQAPRFAPPRSGLIARLGLGAQSVRPLRLLWYGGQYRTFADLADLFPQLLALAAERPLDLHVIAGEDERIARQLAANACDRFAARFSAWSLETVRDALTRCDLVLLPADTRSEMRIAASANRLTRALWAGRAVVGSLLPSYLEFRDAAVLGVDLAGDIRRALRRPAEIERRIAAGQALIAERYTPDAIGRRWYETLRSVRARGQNKDS